MTLESPSTPGLRPTSARAREAVFDRLDHAFTADDGRPPYLDGLVVDACCGVGAMALEALSRGAARAILLDKAQGALDVARRNARTARYDDRCRFLRADVTAPSGQPDPGQVLFLDPPYREVDAGAALAALQGWLAPDGIAVVETAAKTNLAAPPGFAAIDSRKYGAARLHFLRRTNF